MSFKVHSVREISLGVFDGPHATPPLHPEGEAIFLGIPNITEDGALNLEGARWVAEADLPKWTKRVKPQADDIVFTYEATLNRYAVIPEGMSCCLGRRTALIRPNKLLVDHRYLFYYFFTPEWRKQIDANTLCGATVDRIPLTTFPEFKVVLPELSAQREIASTLSAYDDLIETNRRRIALLEEAARLLYREWFVNLRFPGYEQSKTVDGLPEGWLRGSAHDFIHVLSGGTPNTKTDRFWDGDIPFFTPKDCSGSMYVLSTEKTLTDDGLEECNSRLFGKETIFITARGTVGKLALAQRPMAMNQSCYALAPKDGLNNLFLFLGLEDGVEHLKGMASGGVFDTIIVDTFKFMPFIRPSLDVANKFGELVRPMLDQIENLLVQNELLKAARDELLPKLMSGEIQV